MIFRKDAWRTVDAEMANWLAGVSPDSPSYTRAVENYRTLMEAKGIKPRPKVDPNVLINGAVIVGTCVLTIYGENILHQVVYSKFWPKILLPKL